MTYTDQMDPRTLSTNDQLHFIILLKDKALLRATLKQARKVLLRKKYPEHLIEMYVKARLLAEEDAKKAQA